MQRDKDLSADRLEVVHHVHKPDDGLRLDAFLRTRYRRRSREDLKRAIAKGAVTVTRERLSPGRPKPSLPLIRGDRVKVVTERGFEPEVNFGYKILFDDGDICVIDKPPHLPVHPAGRYLFHTLLIHLRTQGFTQAMDADREYHLVHRIDKETSGLMVLSREAELCAHLIQQFAQRRTKKRYLAVVRGHVDQDEFEVNRPLGRAQNTAIGLKMDEVSLEKGGQVARTRFRVLERGMCDEFPVSLVECFPATGRQHQIRVHLWCEGYPLVGDKLYGIDEETSYTYFFPKRKEFTPMSISAELAHRLMHNRHALHASRLEFEHPRTGERMSFESELPSDLAGLMGGRTSPLAAWSGYGFKTSADEPVPQTPHHSHPV